jgi:hypothetical protein
MGMDESPRLEDVLKEYLALANNRNAVLRKEAEEREAQRKKEQEEIKRRYECEVKELALELEKTVNGEYAPVLTRILKAKDANALVLGSFVVTPVAAKQYNCTYGLCLRFESDRADEMKLHFYASGDDMPLGQDRMKPGDLLAMVKIDNGTNPRLALTAWYYKKALTHAVLKEIENLRKAEVAQ